MPPRTDVLPRALASTVRSLVFAVPLVALILGGELFFSYMLYPHVTWRNFVFRMLVEVMVGLWVVLAWVDPRYRPRRTPILVALVLFVGIMAVADLAGVNPNQSLWSNHERMDGLIGLLHLFGFFLVASSVLDRRRHWQCFLLILLAVCLFVCGDAIWQFVQAWRKRKGVEGIGQVFLQSVPAWSEGRGYFRVDARLASPVYLGVYLIFHSFLAALLWCRARTAGLRRAAAAMTVLCLVVLVMTQTRIAWAGLVAGGGVALTLLALLGNELQRRRALWSVGAVGAVAAVAVLVVWLDLVPWMNRVGGDDVESATDLRLALWKMVWQGFLEHPLLGWGQENFAYVYARYFDPVIYGQDVPSWWDHPHNVVLNWLVAGGLPGMLAYLGLYVTAGFVLWKDSPLPLPERCLVTGMLVGYVVFASAQLDNLSSYLLFFAVLAWLHALRVRRDREAEGEPGAPPRRAPLAVAAALTVASTAVGFSIYHLNVVPMRPALALPEMSARLQMLDGPGAVAAAHRALEATQIGRTEMRENLAEQASQYLQSNLDDVAKRQMYELGVRELKRIVEEDPENVRSLTRLGVLLNSGAHPTEAVPYFERAREISPRRQELCFELASAYGRARRLADAAAMFRTGWMLRPESAKARLECLRGAVYVQDRALEDEALDSMRREQGGSVFYPPFRFLDALRETRQWNRMIELLEPVAGAWRHKRVEGRPISRVMKRRLLPLVTAYRETGRKSEAIDLLTEMIDTAPNDKKFVPQARAMRDKIRSS